MLGVYPVLKPPILKDDLSFLLLGDFLVLNRLGGGGVTPMPFGIANPPPVPVIDGTTVTGALSVDDKLACIPLSAGI